MKSDATKKKRPIQIEYLAKLMLKVERLNMRYLQVSGFCVSFLVPVIHLFVAHIYEALELVALCQMEAYKEQDPCSYKTYIILGSHVLPRDCMAIPLCIRCTISLKYTLNLLLGT